MQNREMLITGTTGFIGKYLKAYFKKLGYNVYGTTNRSKSTKSTTQLDIRFADQFNKLPEKKFDVIIHSAGSVNQNLSRKFLFQVNKDGTQNILDWAKRHGCKHFIQLSSTSVYGLKLMGENRKEKITPRNRFKMCIPYSESKAAAEVLVERSDLDYTILRLPAVLGSQDTYLTPTILPRLLNDNFYFAGSRDPLISTLYIRNLGPILKQIILNGPLNDSFNCTDFQTRWGELVKEYASNLKINLKRKKKSILSLIFHFKDKKYLLMLTYSYFGAHYPNDKLKSRITINPQHPWQEGIKEAVNAYFVKKLITL